MEVRRQTWGLGRVTAQIRLLRFQPVPAPLGDVLLTCPEPHGVCALQSLLFWWSQPRQHLNGPCVLALSGKSGSRVHSAHPQEEANAHKACPPGPRVFERNLSSFYLGLEVAVDEYSGQQDEDKCGQWEKSPSFCIACAQEKTCLIYPWKHALLNSKEITALDL